MVYYDSSTVKQTFQGRHATWDEAEGRLISNVTRTTRVQFENIIIDITLLNKWHGLMNNIYVLPNGPTLILIILIG